MHARVLSRHGPRTPDQHSGLPFIQAQRMDGKYRETGLTSTMSNSRASEATSATSTIPGARNSPTSSPLISFARRSECEFQGAINRTWPPVAVTRANLRLSCPRAANLSPISGFRPIRYSHRHVSSLSSQRP